MLRLVNIGNSLPASHAVDPSVEFQPGQCAQLATIGNQVLVTVSNGVSPIGVIDDVKVRAFTNNSWNEVIIVPAVGVRGPSGRLVTPVDIKKELKEAHIIPHSFNSDVDCVLNANNGVITFLKGTPLNYDMTGHGHPDSIRAVV